MTAPQEETAPLSHDIMDILGILPHRYPFLLIDRILERRDDFVVGQKCVTINEWFFQGHFPQQPVMPGVLVIEAMAQTGAILVHSHPDAKGRLVFLAAVDKAKFRRVISPGDVLRIEMTEIFRKKSVGKCSGKVFVDGQLAVEAELTFVVQPKPAA